MDFSDYQAVPGVLEKIKSVDFVAVVGPTAAGKTTLMKAAASLETSLAMVLTTTSRLPRPEEQDGVDYHFRTKDEMLARIARREYMQVAPAVLGDVYATAPEDYPAEGIAMLAVLAEAIPAFRQLPFKSFRVVYVLPPDWRVWQARLKAHGFEPDKLVKRLAEAKQSLVYAVRDPAVHFVVNDNLDIAAADFIALIQDQPATPRQAKQQQAAQAIARQLLSKL